MTRTQRPGRWTFVSALAAITLATQASAQTYPISIRPPDALNINGSSITQGIFNLSGVTAYSDPGGVLTSTVILDPLDPLDDAQANPAIIGGTMTTVLTMVPDDSEVVLLEGFFQSVVPSVGQVQFKIFFGTISADGISECIFYLPLNSSDPVYTQVTSLGGRGLADNQDLFTLLGTTLTLIDNDPALPGYVFTPLENGDTNPWYIATPGPTIVPGAVPPQPASAIPTVQPHGFSGCFGVCTAEWIGVDEFWSNRLNWDIQIVPNNSGSTGNYRAVIPSGTARVDTNITVNTLTVADGAEVVIQNGQRLTIEDGELDLPGVVRIESTGSITQLLFSTDSANLLGDGTFVFGAGGSPSQMAIGSTTPGLSVSTEAGSLLTLHNSGSLGASSPWIFANNGTFRVDGGQLDLRSTEFVNNGVLTTTTNTDVIRLNSSSTVVGGALLSPGTSFFESNGGTLDSVTNQGTVVIPSAQNLVLRDTLANAGEVRTTSSTSITRLLMDDAVSITGTGDLINLGTAALTVGGRDFYLGSNLEPDVLTIPVGANQTFTGPINLGIGIEVVTEGTLRIGAGPVSLVGPLQNNSAVTVLDGGEFEFASGSVVTGGDLVTQGTGIFEARGGTLDSVTNLGTIVVPSAQNLVLRDTLANASEVRTTSSTSITRLLMDDAVSITGTGDLINLGTAALTVGGRDFYLGSNLEPDVLTIPVGANQTFTGPINLGIGIEVVTEGTLRIGAGPVSLVGPLQNNSAVTVLDGGEFEFASGSVVTGGDLVTQGTGIFEARGGTLDSVTNLGTIVVPSAQNLVLRDTLANASEVRTTSSTSITRLLMDDAVSITGTGNVTNQGTVALTLAGSDTVFGPNGTPDVLTIPVGANQTFSGPINLDPSLDLITEGTLRIGAGPVALFGSLQNNSALTVLEGGEFEIGSSGVITDGDLVTEGSGIFESNGGTFDSVTNLGTVVIPNGNRLVLRTTLANESEVRTTSSTSITRLLMDDAVSITGTGNVTNQGTVALTLAGSDTVFGPNGTPDVLTLAQGSVQTLLGEFSVGSGLDIRNEGHLRVGAGVFNLVGLLENGDPVPPPTLRTAEQGRNSLVTIINGGELELSSGARIVGGTLVTRGSGILEANGGTLDSVTSRASIVIPTSRNLILRNTLVNDSSIDVQGSSGTTRLLIEDEVAIDGDGALSFLSSNGRIAGLDSITGPNGTVDRLSLGDEQSLSGIVTVEVPLQNAGLVSPGIGPGTITFSQDLELQAESRLLLELDGTAMSQQDRVVANGSLQVGGRLIVDVDPGLIGSLTPGSTFELIDAASRISGSFTHLLSGERLVATNGASFVVAYGPGAPDPTSVVLSDFELVSNAPADTVTSLSGIAEGGTVTIVINGVTISITTQPGDTAADVVAALAAAINAQFPGAARAVGNVLELTGVTVTSFFTTDFGLSGELLTIEPSGIPLPFLALWLLAGGFLMIGARLSRRASVNAA